MAVCGNFAPAIPVFASESINRNVELKQAKKDEKNEFPND
jgi:hypothetical protein